MQVTKKQIQGIIQKAKTLDEAVVNLYKIVFPDWEDIEKIKGWPQISKKGNQFIFDLLIKRFGLQGGMAWVNNGFSSLEGSSSTEEGEEEFLISMDGVKVVYYPRCPWCGRRHPAEEHYSCAPDFHLEAAYEERFEMD